MKLISSFLFGMLFALGLGAGGMTQPVRIIAFLDFTGAWDPSLAFVMGGAVAISSFLFPRILRNPASYLGGSFELPTASRVDARLFGGAVLFGIGWGLSGYCPGPAIVSLVAMERPTIIFLSMMLVGMAIGNHWTESNG